MPLNSHMTSTKRRYVVHPLQWLLIYFSHSIHLSKFFVHLFSNKILICNCRSHYQHWKVTLIMCAVVRQVLLVTTFCTWLSLHPIFLNYLKLLSFLLPSHFSLVWWWWQNIDCLQFMSRAYKFVSLITICTESVLSWLWCFCGMLQSHWVIWSFNMSLGHSDVQMCSKTTGMYPLLFNTLQCECHCHHQFAEGYYYSWWITGSIFLWWESDIVHISPKWKSAEWLCMLIVRCLWDLQQGRRYI